MFGVLPELPTDICDYPEQRKRMNAMHIARNEMIKVTARQRSATALRSNVPSATGHHIAIGLDVLLYSERPVNEWLGPYKAVAETTRNSS